MGVEVFALGFGTVDGGKIPDKDGYLKDDFGFPVVTKRNDDNLKLLAAREQGKVLPGGPDRANQRELQDLLSNLANPASRGGVTLEPVPRYRVFLLLALVDVVRVPSGEDHPLERSVLMEPLSKAARWILPAVLLVSLASCSDWGDGWAHPSGNAAFQRGDFQKASLSYLAAQGTGQALDVVNYNLGNVFNALGETNTALSVWGRIVRPEFGGTGLPAGVQQRLPALPAGQYDQAVEQFRTALLMKPSSLDAKRNSKSVC